MKKVFLITLLVLVVSGLVFSGCSSPASSPSASATPTAKAPATSTSPASSISSSASFAPKNLTVRVGSYTVGTSMQTRAATLVQALRREYPDWKVQEVIASQDQKLDMRAKGGVELDLCVYTNPQEVEVYGPAYAKLGRDFAKEVPVQQYIFPSSWKVETLVTVGNTGIKSWKDILDKKFPGKFCFKESSEGPFLKRLADFYGVTWEQMQAWGCTLALNDNWGLAQGVEGAKTGKIDIALGQTGDGNPTLVQAATQVDYHILPFAEEPALAKKFEDFGYYKYTYEPGVSLFPFVKAPVNNIACLESLTVVPNTLTDDQTYWVVKGLWNQKDFILTGYPLFKLVLNPETITKYFGTASMPMASGAARFYREQGWIK